MYHPAAPVDFFYASTGYMLGADVGFLSQPARAPISTRQFAFSHVSFALGAWGEASIPIGLEHTSLTNLQQTVI